MIHEILKPLGKLVISNSAEGHWLLKPCWWDVDHHQCGHLKPRLLSTEAFKRWSENGLIWMQNEKRKKWKHFHKSAKLSSRYQNCLYYLRNICQASWLPGRPFLLFGLVSLDDRRFHKSFNDLEKWYLYNMCLKATRAIKRPTYYHILCLCLFLKL